MKKLNKRILSALLAVILLLTNFPVVSAASDGFAIHYEGKAVTEVEFYEHERITVSAEGNPGDAYQWQIQIPGTEQWVNIQGQTGQTIHLSKAVVGSLLSGGSAHVRCAAISGGEEIEHTAALRTTVKKEAPAPQISDAPVVSAPAATQPAAEPTEAPAQVTEPPVEATEAPTEPIVETEPAIETTEPTEATELPEETAPASDAPIIAPEIPAEFQAAPAAEATEAPTEPAVEIVAPVPEATETPTATEPEAEAVAAAPETEPAEVPEATVDVTEAPTEAIEVTEAPTDATEAPTKPAETFVEQFVQLLAPITNVDGDSADATDPTDAIDANSEDVEVSIVTVTIHYRAVDRNNQFESTHQDADVEANAAAAQEITDPYVAHIVSGSDLNVTIPCHVIPGYELVIPSFYEDANPGIAVDKTNLIVTLAGVSQNTDLYVYYKETTVSYTARYFIQNVYNDLYTEDTSILTPEIQLQMKGFPGDEPDEDVIYPTVYGFTALFFQPDTIASDGSTVFEVYYDRNYYLMNFNMDGGYGTAPVYARYGTAFTVAQPTKSGYRFDGWIEETGKRAVNADGSANKDDAFVAALETHINGIDKLNGRVTKIPFSNLTYTAQWTQQSTTYKVAYWILNDNGKKTYLGSTTNTAQSGTTASGEDDLAGKIICGKEGHVHGDDCMNCGHTHTSDCYSLGNQGSPSDKELAAMQALSSSEPEAGYIYRIDYNNLSYYRVNLGSGKWNCWSLALGTIDAMVSGSPLGYVVYTDATGTNYEVYKYHAVFSGCSHTHNDSCAKSCDSDVHLHNDSCIVDTSRMEYIAEKTLEIDGENVTFKTDKNLTVEGDGSTVVNVYYQYKEYTLKFYYARTTGGKDTNGDGIPDVDFTSVQIPGGTTRPFGYRGGYDMGASVDTDDDATLLKNVGAWGEITSKELPSLKSNTTTYSKSALKITISDTDYYYHYLEFKARYRDNISKKWPCDVFNSVERNDEEIDNGWSGRTAVVSAWNPESRVKYVSDNQNSTIKGKYEILDDSLLFRIPTYEDASEVSFLCFWENGSKDVGWNVPELYRYNIYLEALPNQDLTDKVVVTKVENGETKTFYRFNQYDTCDDSNIAAQTQPSMVGYTRQYYTADSETYEGAEVNESNKLSDFQYEAIGIDDTFFEYRTLTKGTDYSGSVYREGYELNFYYKANGPYKLNFWNYNDWLNSGDGVEGGVYYGASLQKYFEGVTVDGTKYDGANDIVLKKYPSTLEPDAYTFAGWYETPEFYEETKVDWTTMTMPDADLTVYAKWEPVKYTTYFYMDYERYEQKHHYATIVGTPHGENMVLDGFDPKPTFVDAENKPNTDYRFVGWFYIDGDGTKKAFNPSEMAVRKELHLFAEWTTSIVQEYEVSYVYGEKLADGTYGPATDPVVEMAADSTGYALEATTKTFTALPKNKLTNFPDGTENLLWLPHTNSHSIVMRATQTQEVDGETVTVNPNVYTFYYIKATEVSYTVRYLDAATGDPVKNEVTTKLMAGMVTAGVVTEPFAYVPGYIPDAFHKRLVLSADASENVIVFYYTKDEAADDDVGTGGTETPDVTRQRYLVVHHFPGLTATDEEVTVEESDIGDVGALVTVDEMENPGFEFDVEVTKAQYIERFGSSSMTDAEKTELANGNVVQTGGTWKVSGTVTSGKDDDTNKPLELHLYYKRVAYRYKVIHKDRETGDVLEEVVKDPEPFESIVSVTSNGRTGYDLYGADSDGTKTLSLKISWDTDLNVITFEYIKKKVTIEYIPVCTDGALTGFGGVTNPLDYDKQEPSGSQAYETSGFHFLGWYTDWGTTEEKLVTSEALLEPETIAGIYDYTYYAVFEPITLTISQTNMKHTDSAVYEVCQGTNVVARVMLTGTDSVTLQAIPAGTYTVREVTGNWTWTYTDPAATPANGKITIVAGETEEVTFDYNGNHVGSCWLHSEAHYETTTNNDPDT